MKRYIPQKPNIAFTKDGYKNAEDERESLKVRRKAAIIDLQKAREMGDLSENGYYKAARFNLTSIDRQLRQLNYRLLYGKVSESIQTDTVSIGTAVTIANTNEKVTYDLVGDFEADPKQKKISSHSPFGKALTGRRVGESVTIHTPSGEKNYQIISIALSS